MCKETPLAQDIAVLQQGDLDRFERFPTASKSLMIPLDISLENSGSSMGHTSQASFALNSSDQYEPLPLKPTSILDEGKFGGACCPSFFIKCKIGFPSRDG